MINEDVSISTPGTQPRTQIQRATFWQRFFAYMIDLIILSIVNGCVNLVIGPSSSLIFGIESRSWFQVIWGIIVLGIPVVYFVLPYSNSGQTLGKYILKIKVVAIDGSPLNWRKGILRYLGYIPSSLIFNLGFLWSIWDDDKQAWHDKLAGTCVVPVSVAREQLAGTIDPMEARLRQERWLMGVGIPMLLLVSVGLHYFVAFVQRGVAEVNDMGPWPGPDVRPAELLEVDLSHLGLEAGRIRNARNEESWSGGNYEEGALVTYESSEKTIVMIWVLRYRDASLAEHDYDVVQSGMNGTCGMYTWAYLGNTGVLHCQFSDAYDKVFWKDDWIVDILALAGGYLTPDVLVDQVRDALAAHWKE